MSKSLPRSLKFSAITSLDKLSAPFSSSSPSGILIILIFILFMDPTDHVGFLCIFPIFFLYSPLIGLFKIPALWLTYSIFHFPYSEADAFYCIFHFIHYIFHLQNLFLFYDFYLFGKHLILSWYFFPWFRWIVFLSFLEAHWVTSKQLFWILYQPGHKVQCLCVRLLENHYYLLVMICFPDSSCSCGFALLLSHSK